MIAVGLNGDMKMNYDEMSDFEINKAVSRLIDFGNYIVRDNEDQESVYLCEMDGGWDMLPVGYFDPCNNPSDAWPIIVKERIGIAPHSDKWMANNLNPSNIGGYHIQTMCYDKNPLRAAMICFLKMKDKEQTK